MIGVSSRNSKNYAGRKKWDPLREPDLGVESLFFTSVKFTVLFSKIQWHLDRRVGLLGAFVVVLQSSEDDQNGVKLTQMEVLQITDSQISEAPPCVWLSSWAL